MVSKKEMKRGNLNVAFDESHHDGNGRDIILAAFSIYPEDIRLGKYGRRNYQEVDKFLGKEGRDYRVVLLAPISDFEGKNEVMLYLFAPIMIRDFLSKWEGQDILRLNLLFDGKTRSRWRRELETQLTCFEGIKISNFYGNGKRRSFPELLYVADCKANGLQRGNFKALLDNRKLTRISIDELAEIKKRMRGIC
jgi:hypothetical protein